MRSYGRSKTDHLITQKSSRMAFEIIKPGLYSTLQDQGRHGHAHQGVPRGGVMDRNSYDLLNIVLGNDESEPVIEATIMGPTIKFTEDHQLAITGSNLSPMINKIAIELNKVYQIRAGDTLGFGRLQSGCRCYIGISGSWQVPRWLDSCSPLNYGNVLQENILKKGSYIEIAHSATGILPLVKLPSILETDIHELTLWPGPEYDLFEEGQKRTMLTSTYRVSNDSNRMGYRLEGYNFKWSTTTSMISSGVLPGTVQITKDGTPIILLQDAQTIGGYPRFGILDQGSLNHMAHIKPGDRVRFKMQ